MPLLYNRIQNQNVTAFDGTTMTNSNECFTGINIIANAYNLYRITPLCHTIVSVDHHKIMATERSTE